jgi:hypothetical protein
VRGGRVRGSGKVSLLVAVVLLFGVACDGGSVDPACASPTAEPNGSAPAATCDDTGGTGY